MNKLIKTILFISTFSPFALSATECDISTAHGIKFNFSTLSPGLQYKSNDKYNHWYAHKDDKSKISYHSYHRRNAVLSLDYIERKSVNPYDLNKKSTIRFYPAIVNNCARVYLRINTDNPKFDSDFSKNNFLAKKKINLLKHESLFGVIFNHKYNEYKDHIGNEVHIIAQGSGEKLVVKDQNENIYKKLDDNLTVKLTGIIDRSFHHNGLKLSSYTLQIEKDGIEYEAPASHLYFNIGKKFKNIREEFKNDILAGNLRYGMNKFEAEMAWGKPDLLRVQGIFLEEGMGEFVKDDLFPYAKDEFPNPSDNSPVVGIESDWYYFNKLPKGQYLVFDKYGLLREYNQIFRINKNKVYKNLDNFIKM